MIALPIPDKRSPVRYQDLVWRGRNLGEIVEALTGGRQRQDHRAHLDPDLRRDLLARHADWRATLGQHGAAQGHLRKQGVSAGDLFIFWGLFRLVDSKLRWVGQPEHHLWGWLQVGAIVPVDTVARAEGVKWRWARAHPHLAFPPDPTNTLYVAADRLSLPGRADDVTPGYGTFELATTPRRLTAAGAKKPSDWVLPSGFRPLGRPALSYHRNLSRWSHDGSKTLLRTVPRGQEFVLDLDRYPEVTDWLASIIGDDDRAKADLVDGRLLKGVEADRGPGDGPR